jgi:hypothetical protein
MSGIVASELQESQSRGVLLSWCTGESEVARLAVEP